MAYDEGLDGRIMMVVGGRPGVSSKKMFGGVCHLLDGNMFCGVYKGFLILRLGAEKSEAALKSPHTRPFDITGKTMKGWIMVEPDGIKTDGELVDWLKQAEEFARTLPPK